MTNEAIVESARLAAKVGIDYPFGWPVPFVQYVTEHDRGDVAPRSGEPLAWRRSLANRTTDLVVRETVPLVPLSVGADRIGHVAMRCAALLSELVEAGESVDRTGQTGKVVEVYPAASLFCWDLAHRGYKSRANGMNLNELVDSIQAAAPWLDLKQYESVCRTNEDAFDAVIASLTARAVVCGQTAAPTPAQAVLAHREGWIALPFRESPSLLAGPD